MYCKHCGKKIADDSMFCNYCGKEVLVEKEHHSIPKEVVQRTIDAINKYDWGDSIEYTKMRYPKADAVKFRICFYTDTFDLNRDYNNFLCLDSEKEVKDSIVKYLIDLMEGHLQTTIDYSLKIYVSTDAFISKDHDENDGVFFCLYIYDSNFYDDEEDNTWVSSKCVQWKLGDDYEQFAVWRMLGLGRKPSEDDILIEEDPIIYKAHKMKP